VRAAIRDRRRVRARSAAATPAIAEVPVEVGPDIRRPGGRLAVLPPEVELAARDVVLGAVRVDGEHDPHLAGVDDLRDAEVVTVAVDEPVHDVEGHLETHVLVAVGQSVEEDLGLVLVDVDVVRDLDRPDRPPLVARADREAPDDVRMRGRNRGDIGGHLGVGVVTGVARREVGRRSRRRGGERGEEQGGQAGDADPTTSAQRSGHDRRMAPPVNAANPPKGPVGAPDRRLARPAVRRTARDSVLGHFATGTRQDVKDAIAAARRAQPAWFALGWEKRLEILKRAAELISRRQMVYGGLMAIEVGKNRLEALGEVEEAADLIRYYSKTAEDNRFYEHPMDSLGDAAVHTRSI